MKKVLLFIALCAATILQAQTMNAEQQSVAAGELSHRLAVWAQGGMSTRLELIGQLSDSGYTPSGCGAIGIGYQLERGKFLLTTGLEFLNLNYTYSWIDPSPKQHYRPCHLGYLQIPVLLGMELPDWYWQIGGKLSYAVMQVGNETVTPFRIAPAGEIGMTFDRWSRPSPVGYKLAFFAECGLLGEKNSYTPRWIKEDFSIGLKFTVAYEFRK